MDGSAFDIVGFTFSGNLIFAEKIKSFLYNKKYKKRSLAEWDCKDCGFIRPLHNYNYPVLRNESDLCGNHYRLWRSDGRYPVSCNLYGKQSANQHLRIYNLFCSDKRFCIFCHGHCHYGILHISRQNRPAVCHCFFTLWDQLYSIFDNSGSGKMVCIQIH